ncbi:MAG: metal-dependent transcriptional regulator [Candidatus Brocadiia bacterium]
MTKELSSTLEDYLEAIFRLETAKGFARVRDIAENLEVAKSAVTAAIQSLSSKGFINYEPYEPITLSEKGQKKAEKIVLRHRIIENFLQKVLGIEYERAEAVACGMEHAIDEDALQRFICFLAFLNQSPETGQEWLQDFRQFLDEGAEGQSCKECVEAYKATLHENTET